MELKRKAQILGKELKALGMDIKHKDMLDMVARSEGHKDYAEATREKATYKVPISLDLSVQTCLEIKATSPKEAYRIATEACYSDEVETNLELITTGARDGVSCEYGDTVEQVEFEGCWDTLMVVEDEQGIEHQMALEDLDTVNGNK